MMMAAGALCADLSAAKAEPNLEKRSRLALDNADDALRTAKQAYDSGEMDRTKESLEEVEGSVELAYHALKDTHKNPSRSPKHFKSAEIKTRGLLRRLDTFREHMSVADRDVLDKVKKSIQRIHDDIL